MNGREETLAAEVHRAQEAGMKVFSVQQQNVVGVHSLKSIQGTHCMGHLILCLCFSSAGWIKMFRTA